MKHIENQTFDEERAFYGSSDVTVTQCKFQGPANGESAFKECRQVTARECLFDLRYPFWHCDGVIIEDSAMTELCRASLWYSSDIRISNTQMHGIKALRECTEISLTKTDIISPEFGWFVHHVSMDDCSAEGEYFMMRSDHLSFQNVRMKGKYSFQYVTASVFENCQFATKDALWHAKNVTVKNSVIKGEYLAWYAENITFENCRIIGTQPLCYCKNLRLINCEMLDADLAFEKSEVDATLTAPIISIKNPLSGKITLPAIGEIIRDDPNSKGQIVCTE